MSVTPDFTFTKTEPNAVIAKNETLYQEYRKALDEVNSLDDSLKKQFRQKIEEFIAKKVKD